MIAAIPVVQVDRETVESVVAAAVAHVPAVPEETTATNQVLRVNDVFVKFAVVELIKSKEAAPVVVKTPVAATADPDVVIDVAVVPYAVVDVAIYPLHVTVVVVEAVTAVSIVLAATHAQCMYQSVRAVAVLATDAVANQIWKLLLPAVVVNPVIVVGVHVRARLQVEFVLVPVLKVAVMAVVAETTAIAEYA